MEDKKKPTDSSESQEKLILGLDDLKGYIKDNSKETPPPLRIEDQIDEEDELGDTLKIPFTDPHDYGEPFSAHDPRPVHEKPKKKMDDDKKALLIGAVLSLGIVLAFLLVFGLFPHLLGSSSHQIQFKSPQKTYELGEKVILKKKDYVVMDSLDDEEKESLSLASALFTNTSKYTYNEKTHEVTSKGKKYLETGEYTVQVQYKENGQYTTKGFTFEVVDTTKPTFYNFKEDIYILQNVKNVKLSDYFEGEDLSGDVTISVNDENVDLKQKGTYECTVTAKDKSGNKRKKKTTIHVVTYEEFLKGVVTLSSTKDGIIPTERNVETEEETKKEEESTETLPHSKKESDDGIYYNNDSKQERSGLNEINGQYYYYDDSGNIVYGWKDVNVNGMTQRMFFSTDGSALTGLVIIDGSYYYFDPSTGGMETGWIYTDNSNEASYYAGSDEKIVVDYTSGASKLVE